MVIHAIKVTQSFLGVSATTLETRPAFDGFKYYADEYCSVPTYDNNASTIEEAVTKCRNDIECAGIEDRWGSGKPPIGLCKRKKGKLAGGGTYLLKKGILTNQLTTVIVIFLNVSTKAI